jgi:ribosomal protein S27E
MLKRFCQGFCDHNKLVLVTTDYCTETITTTTKKDTEVVCSICGKVMCNSETCEWIMKREMK